MVRTRRAISRPDYSDSLRKKKKKGETSVDPMVVDDIPEQQSKVSSTPMYRQQAPKRGVSSLVDAAGTGAADVNLDEESQPLVAALIHAVPYGALVTLPMELTPFDSETVMPIAPPSHGSKASCKDGETGVETAVLDSFLEYQHGTDSPQREGPMPQGRSIDHDHNVFDEFSEPNAEVILSDRDLGIESQSSEEVPQPKPCPKGSTSAKSKAQLKGQRRSKRLKKQSAGGVNKGSKQQAKECQGHPKGKVTGTSKAGRTFLSPKHMRFWNSVCKRKFLPQRAIDIKSFGNVPSIFSMLENNNLLVSVSKIGDFVKQVVYEFYCNLDSSIGDESSPFFGKSFVRRKMYDFNPLIINDFLEYGNQDFDDRILDIDEVTTTLTGGTLSKWPGNKRLKTSCLTSKFAILERVASFNWMPVTRQSTVKRELAFLLYNVGTGVRFNLGQLIFNQVVRHADNKGGPKTDLPFPSLIYGILRSQGFTPDPSEPSENLLCPISIDNRLLSSPHVLDVEVLHSEPHVTDHNASASSTADPQDILVITEKHIMEELAAISDDLKKLQAKEHVLTVWLSQVRLAKSKKSVVSQTASEHAREDGSPAVQVFGSHSSSSEHSSASSASNSESTPSASASAATSGSLFSADSGAEDSD